MSCDLHPSIILRYLATQINSEIEPCAAGATQAQSEGMAHGDTSVQRQDSVFNQNGAGQLPAPRALECSDDDARGECAGTNGKESEDAAHEEKLEQEVLYADRK